jgi:hypothetical protein
MPGSLIDTHNRDERGSRTHNEEEEEEEDDGEEGSER